MQCTNCAADVPEIWVTAINRNQCPNCDKNIMDTDTHTLLSELREAMEKMQATPEEIVGWLMTHYTLIKIGSGEPASFHRAKEAVSETHEEKIVEKPIKIAKPPRPISRSEDDEDEEEMVEKNTEKTSLLSNDRTNIFAKRAGVPDQKKLAEAVQRMKSASETVISAKDISSMEETEDDVYMDTEAVSLDEHSDVIKLLAKDSQELNGNPSKVLEMEKLKSLRARSNFESGGGKFSRSS